MPWIANSKEMWKVNSESYCASVLQAAGIVRIMCGHQALGPFTHKIYPECLRTATKVDDSLDIKTEAKKLLADLVIKSIHVQLRLGHTVSHALNGGELGMDRKYFLSRFEESLKSKKYKVKVTPLIFHNINHPERSLKGSDGNTVFIFQRID